MMPGMDLLGFCTFAETGVTIFTSIVWNEQCKEDSTFADIEKEIRIGVPCDSRFSTLFSQEQN